MLNVFFWYFQLNQTNTNQIILSKFVEALRKVRANIEKQWTPEHVW